MFQATRLFETKVFHAHEKQTCRFSRVALTREAPTPSPKIISYFCSTLAAEEDGGGQIEETQRRESRPPTT